jgi:predicted outer membrane lipoprotein
MAEYRDDSSILQHSENATMNTGLPSHRTRRRIAWFFSWMLGLIISPVIAIAMAPPTEIVSHSPQRPLPVASRRPLPSGPHRWVDGQRGDDANTGTPVSPWRTIAHAVQRLQPGDTLLIANGVYHEHVTISVSGTAEQPITIRAAPQALVVLDGGLPEFLVAPETAWEPVTDGAAHEFRSQKAYPGLGTQADNTNLLGNFADSMVPLHGYRFLSDLRSDNEYFADFVGEKTVACSGIYCGPGVFYDLESSRIHIRLAPTQQSFWAIAITADRPTRDGCRS